MENKPIAKTYNMVERDIKTAITQQQSKIRLDEQRIKCASTSNLYGVLALLIVILLDMLLKVAGK